MTQTVAQKLAAEIAPLAGVPAKASYNRVIVMYPRQYGGPISLSLPAAKALLARIRGA
jgi:hypothetical protein